MCETNGAFVPTRITCIRHLSIAFWALLALTAMVRLPGLTRPLLGEFATKNVVYAMIARNLAEGRASFWYPTVDILNGNGRMWHLVEFPVSAYLTAGCWRIFGGSLDAWGRASSIFMSVASVGLIYLLVHRRHGRQAALGAGLALALSPVSIIYGQSFMLEASVVFYTLAIIYASECWLAGGRFAWLLVVAVCLTLVLLTKIYMLVLLFPLGWMMFRPKTGIYRRNKSQIQLRAVYWGITMALAVVPAACWYTHAYQLGSPESPYAERIYFSVHRSLAEHAQWQPLIFSVDFYRRMLDNLTGIMLTPMGFALLMAGLLNRSWRRYAPWLLAMVALVLLLPKKFYEMNYYTLVILPPFCILIGLGWQMIYRKIRPGAVAVGIMLFAAVVFSARYAVRPAFITPQEDRAVVEAGKVAKDFVAAGEPVVTMHGTTIDVLYYCNRPGWAVESKAPCLAELLQSYRQRGARYLVVVGPELLVRRSPVLEQGGYRIYDLSLTETP